MPRFSVMLAGLAVVLRAPCLVAQTGVPAEHPTLVVLITIDQFRGDYLQRFAPQLQGGLGRLMRGGAWFTNAHQDHAITETAPGHATLLAGRFPRSTGIMMNRIGVDDDASPLIAGGVGPGASPKRFNGTTLADWLVANDARDKVLSVSTKDRAAILPIGRSRSQVYWYSPDGRFTTSRYYRDTLPTWVAAFNDRHMPQTYAGREWGLLLPDSAYTEPDTVEAEGNGQNVVFPHVLPDDPIAAVSIVRGTPFIDDITLAFAMHGLTALRLGTGPQTDLLAISLSGTDYIGHRYGPDSREIHDQVVRVDRAIGTFLDSLYRVRDSSRVVIVLAADHGIGSMPELAPKSMRPAPTRVSIAAPIAALRTRLRALHVDTNAVDIDQQIILLDRPAFKKAGVNADSVLDAFAAAIRAVPGVARVDHFRALLADTLTDPIARRWGHQFPNGAPIELVVTLTPLSLWGGSIASHGSPYDFDSNVPLIFYGAGVQPGRRTEFVRTVDLAPTLAALAGVKPLEPLDGVVLRAAIR